MDLLGGATAAVMTAIIAMTMTAIMATYRVLARYILSICRVYMLGGGRRGCVRVIIL
jgi:hypothetical protein